jgi:hypothetical protein
MFDIEKVYKKRKRDTYENVIRKNNETNEKNLKIKKRKKENVTTIKNDIDINEDQAIHDAGALNHDYQVEQVKEIGTSRLMDVICGEKLKSFDLLCGKLKTFLETIQESDISKISNFAYGALPNLQELVLCMPSIENLKLSPKLCKLIIERVIRAINFFADSNNHVRIAPSESRENMENILLYAVVNKMLKEKKAKNNGIIFEEIEPEIKPEIEQKKRKRNLILETGDEEDCDGDVELADLSEKMEEMSVESEKKKRKFVHFFKKNTHKT